MSDPGRSRRALELAAMVSLAAAVAALSLSVTHRAPAPPAPAPPAARACTTVPAAGGADVVLDLSETTAAVRTVAVRAGQTLDIGGTAGCAQHDLPPAAATAPLLQEIARHTLSGGDADVRYRALLPGTVTIPLCAGSCAPATVVVTVLPAGSEG